MSDRTSPAAQTSLAYSWRRLGRKAVLGILAASALTWAAIQPVLAGDPITARTGIDKPLIVKGSTQVLYVQVSMEAEEWMEVPDSARPPLNVSLVLDRSGSMSDAGKMDYLKRAAKLAVDRLTERDTISVVEYDDEITVLWPAKRAGNVEDLKRLIDALGPRGSTNLAGGLSTGIDEATNARKGPASAEGTITRVVLMSDGLANVGITDPAQIRDLVQNAKRKGVRISALGLGREYDEDLMQQVAESGGGRYYYIEHPTQIARIFEEELATMLRTTARECEFTFEGAPAIRKVEVLGYEPATGRSARQAMEDFYAGEKRNLMLRVEVDSAAEGKLELGTLKLRYRSAKTQDVKEFQTALTVTVTTDAQAAASAVNKDIMVEATLAETERNQKSQVKLYQAGRRDEAARNMSTLARDLETKNATLKDERLKRKIEALSVENQKMMAAAASPEAQKTYLKASKNRLYQAKQGKRALETLKVGDKGIHVERLQEALKATGFYAGPVNGIYDAKLEASVKAFQASRKFESDGVANAPTMDALGMY